MLFSGTANVGVADFFETMTKAATIALNRSRAVTIAAHRVRARCC